MWTPGVRTKTIRKYKNASNLQLLLIGLIPLLWLFIYNYLPMFGIIIAFKRWNYSLGLLNSPWAGLGNFRFLNTHGAAAVIRNTLLYNLVFIFSVLLSGLILSLLMFEINKKRFVKIYQTIIFFPYYISWIVVSYMCYAFLSHQYGILNSVLQLFGHQIVQWYTTPGAWPVILVLLNTWKWMGYYCVLFYAALMSVDQSLFESASIDGAGKLQQVISISIPSIMPVIVVLFLLAIGRIFYADFGLFWNVPRGVGMLMDTTDVLDTYVYRMLKVTGDTGVAAAAGLIQSLVGFVLVLTVNEAAKRYDPRYGII